MKEILTTDRLLLREFELSDAPKMWALNSDPEVLKHTGDAPFSSIEKAIDFIKNYDEYQKNGFGRWSVILKENNEFIGWCGLKKNELDWVDLGFRFLKSHWNKGYATEAAKACLDYGFNHLKLTKIMGRAAKENTVSIRILEKLNMQYWKSDDCNGIHDAVYYTIKN